MNKELIKKANEESVEGRSLSDLDLAKIVKKYISLIDIPKKNTKQRLILCPVGLVGAGKTTVLKPISKKLNLVRISSDEIRGVLKQEGYNFLRTIEIVQIATMRFIEDGYNIAFDSDCIAPEIQKQFNEIGRQRKLKVIWIHIKPPEKFIINKLKNYKHDWLFKDAEDAISNYKRRKPLHKKYLKAIDFYYKFDTSKDDLNLQIEKFINKLKLDLKIE